MNSTEYRDKLAAAAEITAKARHEIENHEALAGKVRQMKLAAAGGELDEIQAADLIQAAERLRIAEIVLPRKQAVLRDALAAEVRAALDVLAALSASLEPVEADAAQAADLLTDALIDPAAAALDGDTPLARDLGVGRCYVEAAMPGMYRAAVLRDRVKTASTILWGDAHIPAAAREIVASWDAELAAIKTGTAILKATLKAAQKARD